MATTFFPPTATTAPFALPIPASSPVPMSHPASIIPQALASYTRSDLRNLYVLIVDDNIINQRVLAHQLRSEGCVVDIVKNGHEALQFLGRTTFANRENGERSLSWPHNGDSVERGGEALPLSIVLLDLEMPVMDGYSCVKHIRRMEEEGEVVGHVPVIAVTANANATKVNTAMEYGMDMVVRKPLKIPELLPQMVSLVRRNSEASTTSTSSDSTVTSQ
ncbi:CheY-like protein [Aulographum hederae CBS 113979]|uniref:CheY-like protein n=1 Tax=Aulographum hederae CBS 113979 TaxID=1176131 RepID=A0A6G1GSD4_9PEZI|nr:CheY-like protein [Aulographum hederae CBS 113979]